jgi:hypothetical protein
VEIQCDTAFRQMAAFVERPASCLARLAAYRPSQKAKRSLFAQTYASPGQDRRDILDRRHVRTLGAACFPGEARQAGEGKR